MSPTFITILVAVIGTLVAVLIGVAQIYREESREILKLAWGRLAAVWQRVWPSEVPSGWGRRKIVVCCGVGSAVIVVFILIAKCGILAGGGEEVIPTVTLSPGVSTRGGTPTPTPSPSPTASPSPSPTPTVPPLETCLMSTKSASEAVSLTGKWEYFGALANFLLPEGEPPGYFVFSEGQTNEDGSLVYAYQEFTGLVDYTGAGKATVMGSLVTMVGFDSISDYTWQLVPTLDPNVLRGCKVHSSPLLGPLEISISRVNP